MKFFGKLLYLCALVAPILADSSINCEFESGLCGWSTQDGWFVANVASGSRIDPGHDHTCMSMLMPLPCGKWLSTISKFNGQQEFIVKSPKMQATTGTSCFSFWYHYFGLERSSFEVMINNQADSFTAETVWIKRVPISNNWIQGYISIPKQSSSFYIFFKAILSENYHDTVGLDDITFKAAPCPRTPDCDLESGLCGWTNHGFQLTNSSDIHDHTTNTNLGHILVNKGPSHMAQISIPLSNLTSMFSNEDDGYCFELWYLFTYERGDPNTHSYLQINNSRYYYYNVELTLEDIYSDHLQNEWNPLYMYISDYYLDRNPMITITSFTNGNTQIAIDDLLIKSGECERSTSCDFETDMCGWRNDGRSVLWVRNTGGTRTGVKHSPLFDTTKHNAMGWFAMIPTEKMNHGRAMLSSPPFKSSMIYSTCFSFNYYAIGNDTKTPVLEVYFVDLAKRHVFDQAILNTTSHAGPPEMGWKKFNYTFKYIPTKFSVQIISSLTENPIDSDIAIDDISFSSSKCDSWPYHTTTTTGIPPIENRWNCDFDSPCYSWSFGANWRITSYAYAKNKVSAPKTDHTNKNSRSKYILWEPLNSQLPDSNTTIVSRINSTTLTDQKHCLSFWYYDSSEIKFTLSVQALLLSNNIRVHEKTVTSNYNSRTWKLVKADIYSFKGGVSIQIVFSPSGNVNASFAIDDIVLVPGMCGHYSDYTYTFDSFDDIEISRLKPLNSYMGRLMFSRNPLFPYAPNKDFTTGTGGYFLFMNTKNDFNITYEDLLTIENIPAMQRDNYKRQCVRFAFQLVGNASLRAYINTETSNDLSGPLLILDSIHKDWVVAEFSYTSYYNHKLILRMVKPFDINSYIALDDLSIISGHCNRDLSCDFDDDICAFYIAYSELSDYDFARYVGPPQSISWPGPAFDHTRRTYGGGYLYMTGYPSTKDLTRVSVVRTPIRQIDFDYYSEYCFSVWTFITHPDAQLIVEINLFNLKNPKDNKTPSKVDILHLSNLTESKWTRHYANMSSRTFSKFKEFIVVFTGITENAASFIAIDDIQIEDTACDFNNKFTCSNNQKIIYSQVCDFYDDCSDGSDEKKCGDCNFESDICGWILSDFGPKSISGTWEKVNAQSGHGPNVDGSGKPNGDYLILLPKMKDQATTIAALTRDYKDYEYQYKRSYFTCTMTFDYYLSMYHQQSSILRVLVGNTMGTEVVKAEYFVPSKQWQKGTAYIGGFTGAFVVIFEGMLFSPNDTLAIDNIRFNNCSLPNPIAPGNSCPDKQFLCSTTRVCIDPTDLCDFEDNCGDNWDESFAVCSKHILDSKAVPSCDFENSIESCGFSKDVQLMPNFATVEWTSDGGNSFIFGHLGGPSSDHTIKDEDGRLVLLYITKESDRKSAEIYSPMMTSSGGDCTVRFFYYNNGQNNDSTNSLEVRVRFADASVDDSGTLFVSNSYLPNWIKGKARYESSSPFQFVFKGTIASYISSISIDDVSFSNECIISDAVRSGSSKHAGTTVVVVIVLLVIVMAIVGYVLYRKSSEGRLSLSLPGLFSTKQSDQSTLANASYNDK